MVNLSYEVEILTTIKNGNNCAPVTLSLTSQSPFSLSIVVV